MKPGGSPPPSVSPLYPVLFAYLLGVAVANRLTLPRPILLAMMAALFGYAILCMARSKKVASILFWMGAFFCLGILALQIQLYPRLPNNHVSHFTDRGRVVLEGVLSRPPERSIKRIKLYVNARTLIRNQESLNTAGTVLVSLPNLELPLDYGDRIRFASRLRRPTNFNNPGGFDYQRYLATREIWATAFVNNPRKMVRVATKQGNFFWTGVEMLRNHIRVFIDRHCIGSARPILKALILGERGTIPRPVKEDFATSGTAHIMAISGLHLGIIAFVLFRGFLWILRQSETITLKTNVFKLSALLTIPPIILYTLVAGARVSTVRATIMIIVYLFSILIDRPRDLLHTLAVAALVITLIDPAALLEPSFQLSFMAVLAILVLVPRLRRLFRREDILPSRDKGLILRVTSWSRDLLLVSAAAIIGTVPVIAYHFHRVSPMGLISNFLVIPLLGFLAIPAGLISALLSLCSTHLALPFAWIAGRVIDLTVWIIHCLASLPGASFNVVTPTLLEIILFYAFLAAILHMGRSVFIRIALAVILFSGAVDAGYWLLRPHFSQTLTITSVDVGQGDCALVEFPGGKRALIDGGGFYDDSFDVGENVVAPFLWKKRIRKIDFLILTHPDPDHLNGLKFIARNFGVEELWDSGLESHSPFFQEFMTIVRQKEIRRVSLSREDESRFINGVIVQPLHPPAKDSQADFEPQPAKLNNLSLVLRLVYGRQTFLFTGDIEKEAETNLLASGVDLESRVIKVPHHGSLSSSTPRFLGKVRPEIAVICVGQRNFLRLPNPKVLSRYERLGCRIFRTDQHGAITMDTDGQGLSIKTFRRPSDTHH